MPIMLRCSCQVPATRLAAFWVAPELDVSPPCYELFILSVKYILLHRMAEILALPEPEEGLLVDTLLFVLCGAAAKVCQVPGWTL